MQIEQKLLKLGVKLPSAPSPAANYETSIITDLEYGIDSVNRKLMFISGHVAKDENGDIIFPGKVPNIVSIEEAYQAAKLTTINCLATIKTKIGSLDQIEQFLKVTCFINATDDFLEHPKVANGCSDFLVELFGDRGRHTRSAVGSVSLPMNTSVEIEMILLVNTTKN